MSSDSRDAESIVSETVNRVEGYVRRGGGGSVAVLLRANKYVGEISAGLGGLDNPLTVEGGEGKTHLSDSSAVLLLISLIRAIEFPGDSSARVHIENSPLQLFFKEKGVECWLGEKKQEISTNGFIKTVIKIFKPIESFMNSHDINQIEKAFRHIAVVYKNTTRLSRVIDFLTKHREANSRGADVSIMTIHQSKGLDFDYVVLPIFPKEYFYRPKSIAVSKGKDGFVNSMASWPNKEFDSLWGDHAGIRKNDEARQCRESICLQYVAMTRARLGVSVILPKESNNITKTVDQMVRCAFSSVESVNKDKNLIYLVERRGATPKHKDREEVDLAKGLADRFLDSI